MLLYRHLNWVAAAITVLSVATVFAQGPNPGQGFRMGGDSPNDPSHLLTSESVQKELALTDDQKAQLQKLRDGAEGGHPFFGGIRGLSQADIQKKLDEHAKGTRAKISKILETKQMERLNELNIQVAGVTAFNFDDVAEKLELTAEQKQQLQSLADESRHKLTALFPANEEQLRDAQKRKERQQKQAEIANERKSNALAILTDEQQAKFEKMQGEKFDVSTIKPINRSFTRRGRVEAPAVVPRPQ
jgi:Spy/CpxP family protein refolding chaperone